MDRISRVLIVCLAVGCMSALTSTADAHGVFKKHVEKKYANMTVSCNACHVKGKPKTERTDFGKLFAKEFKEQKLALTDTWNAKKKISREEVKKYETGTMVPEFDKALKKIKEMTNEDKVKYDDLIKSGKIDGIKEKAKK